MKKKISLHKLFITTIVGSIIVTSFFIGVFWIFDVKSKMKSTIEITQELYKKEKKEMLKHKISSIKNYINKIRKNEKQKFIKNLKDKLSLRYNVAMTLYNVNKNRKNQELKHEFLSFLKVEGNINDDIYCFVIDKKTNKTLFKGFNCIPKNIKEGFIETTCNGEKMIGYAKTFKPLNWLFVYLSSLNRIEERIKQNIVKYLTNYRYGEKKHGYIFISKLLNINGGDCFAKAIVNPNKPEMVGKCMSDKIKDANGRFYRKMYLRDLGKQGYSLLEYNYKVPHSNENGLKLSYMEIYKPYNWIIGTGYYLKDLKKDYLEAIENKFKRNLPQRIATIIIITFIAISVLLILYAILTRTIRSDIETLHNFFVNYKKSKRIDTKKIKTTDIEKIANQINDITQKIEIYSLEIERLLKSYKNLVKYMPDCLILYEKKGDEIVVKDANKCIEDYLLKEHKNENIVGENISKVFTKVPYLTQKIKEVFATQSVIETDYHVDKNGQKHYFSCIAYPLNENECVSVAKDITDSILLYRKSEKEKEKLKKFINVINTGVLVLNEDGSVVYINDIAKQILEIDEMFNLEDIYIVLGLKNWGIITGNIKIINEGQNGCKNCNVSITTKTDSEKWLDMSVGSIEMNKEKLYVVSFYDVTERYKKEKEVEYVAFHDSLTNLYNRRFFKEEVRRMFNKRSYPLTIITYDLNGLKIINDAMGHQKGDFAIKKLAQILLAEARASDVVARIGGDEFAVVMPNTTEKGALKYIERVNKKIERFNKKSDFFLSASYGYAVQEGQYPNLKEFFSTADANMYKNKYSTHRKEIIKKVMESVKSEKIKLPKELFDRYN